MDIYVRLRELRVAHGLKQSELSEILGINQSNVSRAEIKGRPIDEVMYQRLVEKYGEEEVSRYVGKYTWQNIIGKHRQPSRKNDELQDTVFSLDDMTAMAKVITEQKAIIERLEKEIAELKSARQ